MTDQLDVFGGSVPLGELELTGHLRALAQAERELGGFISSDEAGAILHERRGKHSRDSRCDWCGSDGTEALIRLRSRHGQEPLGPPWPCVDCGHENPEGARLCRSCASSPYDDREPQLAGRPRDTEPPADPAAPTDGRDAQNRGSNHGERPSP